MYCIRATDQGGCQIISHRVGDIRLATGVYVQLQYCTLVPSSDRSENLAALFGYLWAHNLARLTETLRKVLALLPFLLYSTFAGSANAVVCVIFFRAPSEAFKSTCT